MRLKLFKKFFLMTSFIILLSLTGMMVILTIVVNNYLAKNNYKTLGKICSTVADFTESAVEHADSIDLSQNLYYITNTFADVNDYNVFIVDNEGIIRSCSCDDWGIDGFCEHSQKKISPNLIKRIKKEERYELNDLGMYKNPHYIGTATIEKNGEVIGFVIATAPLSAIRELITQISKLYVMSAVVPIIIMFFAIYAMTYRLTKPLKQMSLAAKAMARGDFSKRIPVTSDDEIGELAVSFNQMTNSLVQLEGMRRSFVANVSHELKTPMTTIGGFIDGIIDGTIEPERQSYYLGIASAEVKRLSRLVQSMLELAKLESGEFVLKHEDFDFRELLLNVVISQEQRIEQSRINIAGLDTVPNIMLNADRDLIYQVVYNLVDNAVKFTDENGIITFDVRAENKRLVFSVKNTGKGIPLDSLHLVFERFYKVDKSRSANKNSTGLGLYLVKTIVQSHGGSVTVSSRENEFTVFEVTLPLSK